MGAGWEGRSGTGPMLPIYIFTVHFPITARLIQSTCLSGILCGLALGVIVVGRRGDDSIGDVGAKICLSSLLHLGEHNG